MAVPNDVIHVVYRMTLGDPEEEEAQFGMHMQYVQDDGVLGGMNWPDATQEAADTFSDKFLTFWNQALKDASGHEVKPHSCKVTHLDNTGHAIDVATAEMSGQRGTHDHSLPYEVALAVSLYSYGQGHFVADSRRRRGRFYLPPLATSVVAENGRLAASARTDLTTGLANWLNDVQGARVDLGRPVSPGYWRLVTLSQVAGGRVDQVERFSLGDVFDSQRRRRRSQNEVRENGFIQHS